MAVQSLSAITLFTHNMDRALAFYETLGFRVAWRDASFVVVVAGRALLNLQLAPADQAWGSWGRFILHVEDVDALYQEIIGCGYAPEAPPRDAVWGERYFHILDPDGHQVSIARRLR